MKKLCSFVMLICLVLIVSACSDSILSSKEEKESEEKHKQSTLTGTIYFMKDNFIFSAKPDGTNLQQLSTTGVVGKPDSNPDVSEDGMSLVYSFDKSKIYMIPVTGGQEKLIASQWLSDHPTISPDKKYVAFDMSYNLMLIATARTESGEIAATYSNSYPRGWPDWSPDGESLIATELSEDGNYFKLVLIDVNTKEGKDLINDQNNDYFLASYNPTGDKIAVVRAPVGTEDYHLWLMNADGSGGIDLVGGIAMARPAWSPDGNHIAFEMNDSIYIVPASGGAPQLVIEGANAPAWGK
jgi:Tol biopolymer transport system component